MTNWIKTTQFSEFEISQGEIGFVGETPAASHSMLWLLLEKLDLYQRGIKIEVSLGNRSVQSVLKQIGRIVPVIDRRVWLVDCIEMWIEDPTDSTHLLAYNKLFYKKDADIKKLNMLPNADVDPPEYDENGSIHVPIEPSGINELDLLAQLSSIDHFETRVGYQLVETASIQWLDKFITQVARVREDPKERRDRQLKKNLDYTMQYTKEHDMERHLLLLGLDPNPQPLES